LRERSQHIKSLLLVGPEGAGKTMLVHSICTELGATFFDLTATNIVGKYPGKSGLNMLLHLVIKVSKLLQPAIIYIDQADKTFLKKVSKTDKSDPKRLKKDLPRLVRSLTSEDRVMLLGASRCPWECEQKVTKLGSRFLQCVPRNYLSNSYATQLFLQFEIFTIESHRKNALHPAAFSGIWYTLIMNVRYKLIPLFKLNI
jgi:fatty acid synthase